MPFHTPTVHTDRRAAQRDAERMPVNGFGVLVQVRGGERWAIYRDRPAPDGYRAQLCGESVAHFGQLSHVLTCIGLVDEQPARVGEPARDQFFGDDAQAIIDALEAEAARVRRSHQ